MDSGAVQVDATVKDGGMMLLTAFSPGLQWIQGNADVTAQVFLDIHTSRGRMLL